MAIKTYALFDLVGISEAIEKGDASVLLEKFWLAADAWTSSAAFAPVVTLNAGQITTPEVYVATFSDSALMHTGEEIEIDDFFEIALDLKRHIEEKACHCYVIISRNDEISQSVHPALGAHLFGSNNSPRFTKLAGSGVAWVSLHAADKAVQRQKAWHGKYSVYGVGKLAKLTASESTESVQCTVFGKTEYVYALK